MWDLADAVTENAKNTMEDVNTFEDQINVTLNRIPDLRDLLEKTRDDTRKAEKAGWW